MYIRACRIHILPAAISMSVHWSDMISRRDLQSQTKSARRHELELDVRQSTGCWATGLPSQPLQWCQQAHVTK